MTYQYLTTQICLPPGVPAVSVMGDFLRLVFEEYQWFRPARYARAFLDKRIDPEHIDYGALTAYYEEHQNMTVAARTDRDFILISPAKPSYPPYVGMITWETSIAEARKPAWCSIHLRQVAEVMRLFNSPLAQSGTAEDMERKTDRLVPAPDGFGQVKVFTIRDYSEGLAGLFWRNFFGPPFVQLFGERMTSVPAEFKQELSDGIVLIQPYERPTQAGTPEGDAHERQLITHLGPECFYDHERHLKPTRVLELPQLWLP